MIQNNQNSTAETLTNPNTKINTILSINNLCNLFIRAHVMGVIMPDRANPEEPKPGPIVIYMVYCLFYIVGLTPNTFFV